jgi:hypothetical protein
MKLFRNFGAGERVIRRQRIKRLLADANQLLFTNQEAEQNGMGWHTAKNEPDGLHEKNQIPV